MPQISIIVPVYKVEQYLHRCVDSILNQTFTGFELILVDDGSPDKSGRICDEYAQKDNRIHVIHKENGGLSDARNAGLGISTGDYIMFLDSDDYITPDCLYVLCKKDADLVAGTILYSYENGNIINQAERKDEVINKAEFSNKLPDLLGERRLNYVHAKLYNRRIIDENKLLFEDDMLTSAEDTVFNFAFLKYCNNIYVAGKPVHHYMQHSTGLAKKFYEDRYKRFKRLNEYIEHTCEFLSIYNESMRSQINIRKVLSAVWCVDGIENNKNISLKRKKQLLDEIFFDAQLNNAITEVEIDGTEDLTYLLLHGSKKFILYKLSSRFKRKIVVLIYSIMPQFIRRVYRYSKNKKNRDG